MKAKLNNAYENSEQTVKYICIYIYIHIYIYVVVINKSHLFYV